MTRITMAERAGLAAFIARRVLRNTAGYFTAHPLLRWRYSSAKTDRLLIAPQDLRTADATRASEIYSGRFAFAGKVVICDGRSIFEMDPPSEEWATVLLDAPCSSTGTIRRHPDVPWLKRSADIVALSGLQRRLLERAVALTKPGGTLVYCTCSLEPEEGAEIVADLLRRDSGVRRVPIAASEVGGVTDFISTDGDLRTLPCHLPDADSRLGGVDGFYAARLEKV